MFAAATAIFCLAGAAARAPEPASALGANPIWDDGRAEFSTYTGTTERYGTPRPTEAHVIVVKEDLLRTSLVKSDAGPVADRTLEALKMNVIADFPTGTYTYHQMASVFFDRRSLAVLKETMSHTEGCGITFVRVGPKNGKLVHEAHSYWDGEADREVTLAWPADGRARLYADALPLSLRSWAERPTPSEDKVWMLPAQISGRSPIESTRPVEAVIRVMDGGPIDVPAGHFDSRRIAVTGPAGTDVYWFDKAFPHVMLMMKTAAGRSLELSKTQRLDYWKHTAPGDEKLVH
jgi:hypothetical protein